MEGGRYGRPVWVLIPALFLTVLLLAASQLVQAMTPPERPPIPRPSQELDDLRIGERLVALKVYRMVTEAQAQQREVDRWRLVEEVDGLAPPKEDPAALRALVARRE